MKHVSFLPAADRYILSPPLVHGLHAKIHYLF